MGKVQRYKRGISGFISSDKGQRFFNFAYSIGAAVVIWGALFKILHLPGGNMLLSIGMGTEVLMFILTAFDRPPREYHWENVFPKLDHKEEDEAATGADDAAQALEAAQDTDDTFGAIANTGHGGTTIVVGGTMSTDIPAPAPAHTRITPGDAAGATDVYVEQVASLADQMQHLCASTEALNKVSDTLLASYKAITENSENISASSNGYVEQMAALNRNIQGLNTIYEIQLKSISSQIDSIDRVNRGIKDIRDMYEKSAAQSARYCEETEKMARYMQQLNTVYEKMITAMTINMYNPAAAAGMMPPMPQQPDNNEQ